MTTPVIPPTGDRKPRRDPVPVGAGLDALKSRLEARGIGGDVDWDVVEAEVTAEVEAEHAAARRDAWTVLVPEDMVDATVDQLDPALLDGIAKWLAAEVRPNIVIVGPVGVGKTFTAYAIGSQLVARGDRVYAVTTPGLLRSMRPDGDRSVEAKTRAAGYLILDDLGTEALTEWAVSAITDVLDERVRERRPTIVTTNAPYRALADRLGERIMSRLTGGAVILTIGGEDRRRRTW